MIGQIHYISNYPSKLTQINKFVTGDFSHTSLSLVVTQPHFQSTKCQVSGQPLLHCIIAENDLSFLALTET